MGRREARKIEQDLRAQERGHLPTKPPRLARDFVYATHPDTGIEVVFVAGEALPAWVPLTPAEEAELDEARDVGMVDDADAIDAGLAADPPA